MHEIVLKKKWLKRPFPGKISKKVTSKTPLIIAIGMRVSDFLVKIRKILLNKVISPRLFPLAYVHSVYTETLKHSSRILVGPILNFSLDLGSGGSKAAPEGCQI